MALVHEFENSGNWLFKRRSWLPVFMIAAGIVMMYLGNRQAILFDMRDEFIFLSVSIFGQRSVGFTIVFGLLYWLYYERIMFAEEQYLRRKFGDIYDKWSETVSSFIPYSFNFIPPKLPFSVRNVLKREYNSFFNIFVIFTLMDIFRNYFLSERIYLTEMWIYLSASAFVIWIVVRTIHKHTQWLEVEGR
jgi:hypothetical protein